MEPDRVDYLQLHRQARPGRGVIALGLVRTKFGRGQAILGRGDRSGQVGPALGGDGRGQGAFDQRRSDQANPVLVLRGQKLDRRLGGHHRRAQIHQHDRSVRAQNRVNGLVDRLEIGPQAAVRGSAGVGDRRLGGHLPGQFGRAPGQGVAVGYDYQPDHRSSRGSRINQVFTVRSNQTRFVFSYTPFRAGR